MILPFRRQYRLERFRAAHFCTEGVHNTLLHPPPVLAAVVLPLRSPPLCVILLARDKSAQLSVALLPIHVALILLPNLRFFLQPVIFISKESNFFDDMSFTKTGRRKGGCVESYERCIVWILNLGLEGKHLKFFVSYDAKNGIFSFSIFAVNNICQISAQYVEF